MFPGEWESFYSQGFWTSPFEPQIDTEKPGRLCYQAHTFSDVPPSPWRRWRLRVCLHIPKGFIYAIITSVGMLGQSGGGQGMAIKS